MSWQTSTIIYSICVFSVFCRLSEVSVLQLKVTTGNVVYRTSLVTWSIVFINFIGHVHGFIGNVFIVKITVLFPGRNSLNKHNSINTTLPSGRLRTIHTCFSYILGVYIHSSIIPLLHMYHSAD